MEGAEPQRRGGGANAVADLSRQRRWRFTEAEGSPPPGPPPSAPHCLVCACARASPPPLPPPPTRRLCRCRQQSRGWRLLDSGGGPAGRSAGWRRCPSGPAWTPSRARVRQAGDGSGFPRRPNATGRRLATPTHLPAPQKRPRATVATEALRRAFSSKGGRRPCPVCALQKTVLFCTRRPVCLTPRGERSYNRLPILHECILRTRLRQP